VRRAEQEKIIKEKADEEMKEKFAADERKAEQEK